MTSIEDHYTGPDGDRKPGLKMFREKPGKKVVFEAGYGLQIIALILLFVAFVTAYWIECWPRVHSGFRNIGLWQVCLAGLILEADISMKSYHGCWWLLSTEFRDIRSWVNPWWFVLTQITVTLCILAQIVNAVLMGILLSKSGEHKMGSKYKRNPLLLVHIGFGITFVTAVVMFVTVLLFGLAFYLDRRWLPMHHLNYPSWSFGCAVMSTIFSVFASIAQFMYVKIVRQEQREPPMNVPASAEVSFMHDVSLRSIKT